MAYNITLCAWNANGIKNKQSSLIQFLQQREVDIMAISETKLTTSDKLKIRGYDVVRKDRLENTRGGGVIILIKRDVDYTKLTTDRASTLIEHAAIKLVDGTIIVSVYNKPSSQFSERDIHYLTSLGNKVLIIGDLNARHSNWNNNRCNRNGNTLYNYTEHYPIIVQHTDSPTHFPSNGTTPTTIDIVINKNVNNVTNLHTVIELDSDHNPVMMKLNNQTKKNLNRTITLYKTVNWSAFRKTLDKHIRINNKIETAEEIDDEVDRLTEAVQKTKKKHCRVQEIQSCKEKMPETILQLIKQKHKARRKWQRTSLPQDKDILQQLTHDVKREIRKHLNQNWTDKIKKLSTKDNSIWKMTKMLKNKATQIPALNINNNTIFTDEEKAEEISNQFAKVHQLEEDNDTEEQQQIKIHSKKVTEKTYAIRNLSWQKYMTNPDEIKNKIRTLPNKKSPGKDEVDNMVLKNLSRKGVIQLTYIINAVLKHQHYPTKWKQAIVVPIPKPGKDQTKPENYRPISLLSSMSKLCEKIILERLNELDRRKNITPDCQFGFRKAHNTTQQIVRIINDTKLNFNKEMNTVMILLDMQKAFDRVWIDGLVSKLDKIPLPPYVTKLLSSYLSGRTFQVRINKSFSSFKTVAAGVPQGSVLGPKLYTYYLSDFPVFEKTKTALYADDTAIYAHSYYSEVAAKQIQIHMYMLEKYFKKWKLTINTEKTEVINFTKKFTNNVIYTPIKINGIPTHTKNCVKYLGMHLDQRLTYEHHINAVLKKAYGIMKSIFPLVVGKTTTNTRMLLYKAIIRPTLTYAAPAWCGAAKTRLRRLQVYQNKYLRLATASERRTRIEELHHRGEIQTIQDYISEISQKFYEQQIGRSTNNLIHNITQIRSNYNVVRLKHKLPYQHLPIFDDT